MASNTVVVNRGTLIVGAVLLVGLGAAGAWLWRSAAVQTPRALSETPMAAPAISASSRPPVTITLTKEAVERAGIEVATVSTSREAATLRIPGVVRANAYKTVSVTPLTAGRVTRVLAELGQSVRRGQLLAEVYSPDLAEARTKYLSARAELGAHELELQRTEKLVAIGAASRQELEKIHAEHTAAIAAVDSYRSRLALLGVTEQGLQQATPSDEGATLKLVAPSSGVVTSREINAGLNVEPSMSLFTIADLSDVWVVGDLYERDFAAVSVGAPALVTFAAYADLQVTGKVAYIDPQLKPETRTAQIRLVVPNPMAQLRLGMLAEVRIGGVGTEILTVPRIAIQTIGDRSVVYVADASDPTRFVERDVRIDSSAGTDAVRVLSGLQAGDVVVTAGSFSIRAERDRIGSTTLPPASTAAVQSARVQVTDNGYEPSTVTFRAGVPARLTFVRTSDRTCGTEVVIPSLGIRRALPLNQAVDIDFTPEGDRALEFACGMNMLKGSIVVGTTAGTP